MLLWSKHLQEQHNTIKSSSKPLTFLNICDGGLISNFQKRDNIYIIIISLFSDLRKSASLRSFSVRVLI